MNSTTKICRLDPSDSVPKKWLSLPEKLDLEFHLQVWLQGANQQYKLVPEQRNLWGKNLQAKAPEPPQSYNPDQPAEIIKTLS